MQADVRGLACFLRHPGDAGILTSTDLYLIGHGQVKEQWFEADYTGFLQELGLDPAKTARYALTGEALPGRRLSSCRPVGDLAAMASRRCRADIRYGWRGQRQRG